MGASSNPGGPASHPARCLWPGKAVEESPQPCDPAPTWDPGGVSRLLTSDWCSTGHSGHLGSESSDGRSSSLSLLLCVSDYPIKMYKYF